MWVFIEGRNNNKFLSVFNGVFRAKSNIYDGIFFTKIVNGSFLLESFNLNVGLGSKLGSGMVLRSSF